MEFDYARLRLTAVKDMTATIACIGDAEWEEPSLCDGWQIRHVPSHLVTGYLFEPHQLQEAVARVGSVPERPSRGPSPTPPPMNPALSQRRSSATPDRRSPQGSRRSSRPRTSSWTRSLDVAIPLGLPTDTSEEQLLAALAAMPEIEGFIGSKERAGGLRLEATDVAWAWGQGPVVRGPAHAILLALSGRPCGLEHCEGDGMESVATKQGVDGRRRGARSESQRTSVAILAEVAPPLG